MTNVDYLYNPKFAKDALRKDYFIDKKLSFRTIENGMILPHKTVDMSSGWNCGLGGIVDGNGKYVKSSHMYISDSGIYTPPE